jgi:hypothetical protein
MQSEGEIAETVCKLLDSAKRHSGPWAAVAATHWLDRNGAGCPDVPLMAEKVREDAAFWASCAHQAELEAYAVASITALEKTVVTENAAKRLAATAYKTLTPESRLAFIKWAEKQ